MRTLLTLLLIAAVAVSCQKSKDTTEQTSPGFESERQAFFSNLMAPTEAAAQLQATGADFNSALLNDPNLIVEYINDEVKAAANLGIYLADLNYCIAYKQPGVSQGQFTAAYELAKSVNVDQDVLQFLKQRYTENLEQHDSAKAVVNELFNRATASLQGAEREKYLGIAMSAYQIENLHLALGVIESYPKDMLPDDARMQILAPLFNMVLHQQKNVETIYGFLKSITDVTEPDQNPNYPYYAKAFEELIGVYKNLDIEAKIANNQASELLNDAVVRELSEKVNAIRKKIVSIEYK